MTIRKVTTAAALQMLADAVMEDVASLEPGRLREEIPGWDSMGALMLMAELDEHLGLVLDADASRAMATVADYIAHLRASNALLEMDGDA